jgi:hypothetical protein
MWQSSAIPFVFVDGSGMCVCVCVCAHVQTIMKTQLGSSGEVKRKKVAAKCDIPLVDLSTCKYEVLRIALERNGWEEGSENNRNCHIVWTDLSVGPERLLSLKQGQKINHFYGMLKICRKKSLFRTLTTMRKYECACLCGAQCVFFCVDYFASSPVCALLQGYLLIHIKIIRLGIMI